MTFSIHFTIIGIVFCIFSATLYDVSLILFLVHHVHCLVSYNDNI